MALPLPNDERLNEGIDPRYYVNIPPNLPPDQWPVPPSCLLPENQPEAYRFDRLVMHIIGSTVRSRGLPYTIHKAMYVSPVACKAHKQCEVRILYDVGQLNPELDFKAAKRDIEAIIPVDLCSATVKSWVRTVPDNEQQPILKLLIADYVCLCRHNKKALGNMPLRPVNTFSLPRPGGAGADGGA